MNLSGWRKTSWDNKGADDRGVTGRVIEVKLRRPHEALLTAVRHTNMNQHMAHTHINTHSGLGASGVQVMLVSRPPWIFTVRGPNVTNHLVHTAQMLVWMSSPNSPKPPIQEGQRSPSVWHHNVLRLWFKTLTEEQEETVAPLWQHQTTVKQTITYYL